MTAQTVEPWLRGTLAEVEPVRRQVLHALQLTREDAECWCASLTTGQLHARPFGLPSVAFHLRHIVGSLDRLLTYAEGGGASHQQLGALGSEMEPAVEREKLLRKFAEGLLRASARVLAFPASRFEEICTVGRQQLPVPAVGLLIHCAEHTQRHAGQMVTTAKLIQALPLAAIVSPPEEVRP